MWTRCGSLVAKALSLHSPEAHMGSGVFLHLMPHPAPWESTQGWLIVLKPCIHMEDLEDYPGSYVLIGSALAIVNNWGVNQCKDLSLHLCFCL